ncbi:hypothetical protein GCM10010472_04830 [Pseudonocardia halophobica]|uniref:Uncharacterized protein n=1 Tax=Pseudonocardia halophobica TaxID=29401 RepID=A0A9W6L7L7_9PSEU|nr:hypothetical protein [Pseudonocardia halophobica]GLL15136.1 hypothetical protein GCM10017577_62850 [Pseudonocardia halophobica]
MPQKGLDPLQEDLPGPVREVVTDLRTIYTDGPFDRLRQVEEAIVRSRADTPGLVTVSSATCSRMLGPRRSSDGRSALPRWPSVKAFLVVHGVDPEPYEARWTAARDAWAAGEEPEESADRAADPADGGAAGTPAPARRSRFVALALAGLALFGAGTAFGLLLGRGTPEPQAVAASPPALPGAVETVEPAGPTGVNCDVGGEGGDVRFLSVASDDGRPGIPIRIRADLEIVKPADPGHTYWLMLRPFTEGMPFFAKAPVRTDSGPASFQLAFDSPIGSVRDLFVVEADAGAGQWLRESHEHDGDSGWAQKRGALPPGTDIVSGTCRVERTR